MVATTGKVRWSPITSPSIGRATRSRSSMTRRRGARASQAASDAGCMSAAVDENDHTRRGGIFRAGLEDAGCEHRGLLLGGFHRVAGLIFRQAHDRGYDLQLIGNSAMTLEDFPMIAGPGLEGTVMAAMTDTRGR